MRRRIILRWIPVAAVICASLLATAALPSAASAQATAACPAIYPAPAYCDVQQDRPTATLRHIGWTYLNLNYCPQGQMCAAIFRSSIPAWITHDAAGRLYQQPRQTSLSQGWVYVYPYPYQRAGESWRWAWTQATGWVAVTGGRFELHYQRTM